MWIPVGGGVRLSARLWLPEGAAPVPAILEYIPYRKRDDTRWRDEPMHGYFAGHGYASVRIDVRGSGTSDGVLLDEYSDEEWADGLAALRWIAAQPWCDGRIGLLGKSWGGINALQLAALRPPELRCVVTVCSTDDRWATDAHWMGGCLLTENFAWGGVLQTLAMRPQDPELVGASWRDTWLERLDGVPLYAARWLRHDTRDAYWRRGSVREDYGRIDVPVLAVSGWADAYADAVPRLLEGLEGPARGWVGPWAHVYPHDGVPGPAAGFLQVALEWWDRWLREKPGTEESGYRVWMTEGGGRPWDESDARGRWVFEPAWPTPGVEVRRRALGSGRAAPLDVPWTGLGARAAGGWCPFGLVDLPVEQTPDDREAATFDLPILERRLEVLGAPVVELELDCDRPHPMVAVRLCDVAPDGTSVRVSYGLLDLAFRDGFERRVPFEPGRRVRVVVALRHCAHAFPRGHRLRVAVSSSYWPVAWPAAEPFHLRLFPGGCSLLLPERAGGPGDVELTPLPPPEVAAAPALAGHDLVHTRRVLSGPGPDGSWETRITADLDGGGEPIVSAVEPLDLETGWGIDERFTTRPHEPASSRAEAHHVVVSRREGWATRLDVHMVQDGSPGSCRLTARVVAREDGRVIHERKLREEVSR